jgi:very-short-patch-repair endonuclease
MAAITNELEKARQSLLDLTMRNRLLNYRPTASRSIRVTGEVPSEIYDALVLREKTLEFRAIGRRKRRDANAEEHGESGVVPTVRDAEVWISRAAMELAPQHTDRYLQTPYDDESLEKKLFRMYHEGHSAVEEQGYTVLHLAIAFLEWFESDDSDQPRRAPLILIPVELERVRAGDFSKVKWTGEDVFANISLVAKLGERGVVLPPFEPPEEKSGIDAWLQQVVYAVAAKERWRVLSEMTLDFFSFTKFVMFKDLDPATWPEGMKIEDHPLLATLFQPHGDSVEDTGFHENEVDRKLTARDFWHVRDADPSQIAVIEDVKAGRNLVVQGPPGTGKSQTIANLIAETLAAGKTVLFVSEKMAALEVVKSRLDEAGLGPFCLELHSRKANKRSVLLELQHALGSQPLPRLSETELEEHELLKNELNRYVGELGSGIGLLQWTPYKLFEMRLEAMNLLGGAAECPCIPNSTSLTAENVVAAEQALREVAYVLPLVQPAASHPWRHSKRAQMLPHQQNEVAALLLKTRAALHDVQKIAASLAAASGVRLPLRLADTERSLRAAGIMTRLVAPAEASLLLGNEWNAPNPDAERLIDRVAAVQHERAELAKIFVPAALEGSHGNELDEFAKLAARTLRFFNGRYRSMRAELATLYLGAAPPAAAMVASLSRLVEHQNVRDAFRGDVRGKALFGVRWRADKSDVAELRDFAEWLVTFRGELLAEALTKKAVDVAAVRFDAASVRADMTRLENAASVLRSTVSELLAELMVDEITAFAGASEDALLTLLDATMENWQQQLPALYCWSQFNAARDAVRATAAATLEPLIATDQLSADAAIPFFRASLAESLLRVAFDERASLGRFAGALHEQKIARFRELDHDLVRLNRSRLSRRLHERRPVISGGASPRSEVGILLGEFNRRRAHMPIRKLLSRAGGLIQRIKPCFLMSPLSIAQFLDPRGARFDLIVFDEASQVRPEDAIGALLRGNQLVVMGDTQQLPPTSFFDHLGGDGDAGDDDDDQTASVSDVESILHQCARSYPTKMLRWHYRSRHESLIAISNSHFYANRLLVYPSAIGWDDELGLHFVHVPEARYDRGKSAVNRVEARAVAAAAIAHYRAHPRRSLGVGTFNMKQQQAILEEIDLLLKANAEMEPFFRGDRHDHFFVKNLETIQGDERDVIFISVAFGRDMNGKLSLNFGPINREGGERRLNVLMSRAREKCVIFCNFRADDLALDEKASKGLHTLKAMLQFAETRRGLFEPAAVEETKSEFENAVADVLRAHGLEVKQKVGSAGFRVDIAVVDPERRGRYLLAVECDGPKYHTAPVARGRDRLSRQMLESLGWRVHRIWSIDWYRNRAQTIEQLLQAVSDARNAPSAVITAAAADPSSAATNAASSDVQPERDSDRDADDAHQTFEVSAEGTSWMPRVRIRASFDGAAFETLATSTPSQTFADIPDYEVCRSLRIAATDELHLLGADVMALAVEDVVSVEGPVHVSEVVRRIRTLQGLQRAGNRIRDAVDRGIEYGVHRGLLLRDGEFLRMPHAEVRLRRRGGDAPAKIDVICDEEITAAMRHVLRLQFATSRGDLITAAARRLGIHVVSGASAARIEAALDCEISNGGFVRTALQDVALPQRSSP